MAELLGSEVKLKQIHTPAGRNSKPSQIPQVPKTVSLMISCDTLTSTRHHVRHQAKGVKCLNPFAHFVREAFLRAFHRVCII